MLHHETLDVIPWNDYKKVCNHNVHSIICFISRKRNMH